METTTLILVVGLVLSQNDVLEALPPEKELLLVLESAPNPQTLLPLLPFLLLNSQLPPLFFLPFLTPTIPRRLWMTNGLLVVGSLL